MGVAEFSRSDLSPLFFNLPEQYAEPFSLRVSNFTAMPKPPPKPPDLQLCSRPLVLYPPRSSQLPFSSHSPDPYPGHTISVRLSDLSFPSTISLSFGQWKLLVLLLAGEGTSGSWIPGFVIVLILVRCCNILGLAHELSVASSLSTLFLHKRLYIVVTLDSSKDRFSSLSLLRKKRIISSLVLSMRGKLSSVWKPRIFSSFMERVLLSSVLMAFYALMALALALPAFSDHSMVLGLKKVDFKSTSLQSSAIQSLDVWFLIVVVMVIGGVLLLASGKEFRY